MDGLVFLDQPPVVASVPNRADVACFAGFVKRRSTPLPAALRAWLDEQGWPLPKYRRAPIEQLLDVPVPLGSWDVFDQLFAWEQRLLDGGTGTCATYLGAAVRSFFAQGGRKCYVVRVGDPWPLAAGRRQREPRIAELIPGYPYLFDGSPVDRERWHGIAHLFGLPDVSFLCLPDLPDAVAVDAQPVTVAPAAPPPPEQFVECSTEEPVALPRDRAVAQFRAPRCDQAAYEDWARALRLVADLLARRQREVQLVAAVPMPLEGSAADRDLLSFLVGGGSGPLAAPPSRQLNGLASAFVQLGYPWLRTWGAGLLAEQVEGPDGVLTGMLARGALARGAFRSAAGLSPADVYEVFPPLRRDQMLVAHPDSSAERAGSHSLVQRVSLFGPTPAGFQLLSDVTTSLEERYRPASVNRLVSAIVRAARRLGEDAVFEASGERLWAQLEDSLAGFLAGLEQAGALAGTDPDEAYEVRCDRSTMSQNDIDAGRLIVRVSFQAALPIERITVVLAMDEGGQVSLAAPVARELVAA